MRPMVGKGAQAILPTGKTSRAPLPTLRIFAVLTYQFAAADSFDRALADALSSRNVTFTAMSGRTRGSLRCNPMRTRTVAFSRLAVGTMAMTDAGMVQSG